MIFDNIGNNLAPLIIGLFFAVVGVALLIKQYSKKKNNTESVMGEITRYDTEIRHDSDGETVVYYAVVKYCVGGNWYENREDVGRGRQRYQVGEKLELLYNPEKPEQFSIAGDKVGFILAIACFVIGLGAMALAFFT